MDRCIDGWQRERYELCRCQRTSSLDGYQLYWIVLAVLARSIVFDHPNGSDIRAFEKALLHISG